MNEEPDRKEPPRRLIGHGHRKRSLWVWIVPLAIILAVIIFLPKLVALLEK